MCAQKESEDLYAVEYKKYAHKIIFLNMPEPYYLHCIITQDICWRGIKVSLTLRRDNLLHLVTTMFAKLVRATALLQTVLTADTAATYRHRQMLFCWA